MFDIRVTDPKNEFYGQILKGSCFYYDIRHTGEVRRLMKSIITIKSLKK
ncbi:MULTISPECIES: hypothetical protein [Clostridium]|nr:hypothetical protein [Clostridium sporogenes]AJD29092.1 hypothetical protein T258_3929 [Clostridium botulinum Prevot_594]